MLLGKIINKVHDTLFRAVERHDLNSFEYEPDALLPVYGVYHVFCDIGWQNMVAAQIGNLKTSGLLERTTRLYISCIVNDKATVSELMSIVDSDKAELISVEKDPTKFEYPALSFLHRKACECEALFYYFHTKGISYQSVGDSDLRFNRFKHNIEAWRLMMEHFLFNKWRVAINVLTSGYDTYGCYRLPPPPKSYYLYAGNFWWARSLYLRRLPKFTLECLNGGRFYAEEWLYTAKPHDFSAFDTMADLYYVNMEPCLYADEHPPFCHITMFVLKYNWHKFRKHVLRYDYKAEYQHRYQVLRRIM